MASTLQARFERALTALQPQLMTQGALIAYSGGLDSTALAHMALRLRARSGAPIYLAHIHHQLRASADHDAAHCAQQAARWGVPLEIMRVEVEHKNSTQQQARISRYEALALLATRAGVSCVMSAHHEDDLLETALFRLTRGSSLRGIGLGLTPQSPLPYSQGQLTLLRPLLGFSRAQLEAYVTAHALAWVEDPTNAHDDYARNQLRHHVMPALLAEPSSRQGMLRTLAQLSLEAQHLEDQVEALYHQAMRAAEHTAQRCMDAALLGAAAQPVGVGVLQRIARELELRFGPEQYEAILSCCAHVTDEAQVMKLPSARATWRDGALRIERLSPLHPEHPQATPIRVTLEAVLGHADQRLMLPWYGRALWLRCGPCPTDGAGIALERCPARITLRGPAPGESLQARAAKAVALKELLRQLRVPATLRWRWPCLADGDDDQVLALAQGAVAAPYSARAGEAALWLEWCDDEIVK